MNTRRLPGVSSVIPIASKLYEYAPTLNTTTSDVNLSQNELTLTSTPANGHFTITGTTGDYNIEILNATGQVYQTINSSGDITVDISDLPAEAYLCSNK